MTDPYTPSPEAVAAFNLSEHARHPHWRARKEVFLEAFDRGVAATRVQQYAATREALMRAIDPEVDMLAFSHEAVAERANRQRAAGAITDALLASGGPLVDVREVQGEVIEYLRKRGHLASADAVEFDFGIEARA